MMKRHWHVPVLLSGMICLMALWSCAGRAYLIVDYTIPKGSQQLNDQSVRLRIDDQRKDRNILAPSAADKFQAFDDRYSLAWVTPDKGRILAGEHDLEALFKRAFEKRLSLLGAATAPDSDLQSPELSIVLEELTVDLKGQKWISEVAYLATLTLEGHPITREQIRGTAERIRIIGRKGADMVLSDIFTEVINRLDVVTLFQKAELIP